MPENMTQSVHADPVVAQGIATREDWLVAASGLLRPIFSEAGIAVPDSLRISCGWPYGSRRGSRSDAIGQCWARKASNDGASEIFISPALDDSFAVAAVMVHEFVHAADDCRNGHKKPFRDMAIRVGLKGPMRATSAGPELARRLNALCEVLGPYPHARLDPARVTRTQGTRLIKIVCDRPGHNYSVWTTRMWLDVGTPVCPCGSRMSEIARRI
jgi:hypothetical protein